MLLAAFPIFCTGQGEAASDWEVGDSWALSGEKNIGLIYESLDQPISEQIISSEGGAYMDPTLISDTANGSMSLFVLFEVVSSNSTTFTLDVTYAGNFWMSIEEEMSADVPAAGTYDTESAPESTYFEQKTFDLSARLVGGVSGSMTLVLLKSDMSITSVTADGDAYLNGDVDFKSMPIAETDDNNITLSYRDVSASMVAESAFSFEASISPGLDLVPGSMTLGDEWTVLSSVTYSGDVSGNLDVTGIPDTYLDEFVEAYQSIGITGFPIDIEDITIGYDDEFENGEFGPETNDLNFALTYRENHNVEAVDGSTVSAQCISNEGYSDDYDSFSFYIDPENQHILATESAIQLGEITVILETHSVPVREAEDEISTVNEQVENQATVDEVMGAGESSDDSDSSLMIVLVIVAVVVIVLVAAVMLMRRKGKT
jgi:hypothetical protein